MGEASSFLALAISIDLPLAIVAIVFHAKKIKPANVFLFFFNLIAFGLIIGTIATASVALAKHNTPCAYVAMGLSLGGLVVSLAVMLITFDCIRRIRHARMQRIYYQKLQAQKTAQYVASLASKQASQPEPAPAPAPAPIPQPVPEKPVNHSMDYIDEIKRLKELLDCGAITQEEFDAKKKKLLS